MSLLRADVRIGVCINCPSTKPQASQNFVEEEVTVEPDRLPERTNVCCIDVRALFYVYDRIKTVITILT